MFFGYWAVELERSIRGARLGRCLDFQKGVYKRLAFVAASAGVEGSHFRYSEFVTPPTFALLSDDAEREVPCRTGWAGGFRAALERSERLRTSALVQQFHSGLHTLDTGFVQEIVFFEEPLSFRGAQVAALQ